MPFVSALSFVGTTLLLTEKNIGMRRVNRIFTNPTNIHAPKRMIGMPRILYLQCLELMRGALRPNRAEPVNVHRRACSHEGSHRNHRGRPDRGPPR